MPDHYASLKNQTASTEYDDSFELEDVQSQQQQHTHQKRPLIMPRHFHEKLNAYKNGLAGDTDSDSDDEAGGSESSSELRGKESLLRRARAEAAGDLEAQPAWATDKKAQNGPLNRRLALPTILVLVFVVTAALFAGQATLSTPANVYQGAKSKISLDDVLTGKFFARSQSIDWLAEAGDGVYSRQLPDGSIELHDIGRNSSRMLVKGSDILNHYGIRLSYQTFRVSHDLRYILFGADQEPVWRHSSRFNFWIHDLESGSTVPLTERNSPSKTAIAKWATQGHSVAYVEGNDLYVTTSANFSSAIRITNNGNETIFNGIPDWAYEEEVFGSDSAVWWSPDGKKLAYLSFDESEVQVYSYPIYNPDRFSPGASSYPKSADMRYPKPGTPNPKVTLSVFDLEAYQSGREQEAIYTLQTENPLDIHDRIVTEVAWVGDHDLMVRESTRAASRERIAHFDFLTKDQKGQVLPAKVTRDVDYEKMDGGCAEAAQTIHAIDAFSIHQSASNDVPSGYLDILPNQDGFSHLAYFSPADAAEPVFLTSGDWEIDGGVKAVDLQRRLIYFIAANPSIERHLYSVPLPTASDLDSLRKGFLPPNPNILTDLSSPGFYDASFSPQAGYYLLHQRAGLPWQRLYNVQNSTQEILVDNAALNQTLAGYQLPKTTFTDMLIGDNIIVNIRETLPPNMDVSGRTKYPVVFRPYGGPNSQTVQHTYRVDFTHFIASTLGYIVVEVDGRGTGYRGRKFRSMIRKNLGEVEAADQIAVAEEYAKLPYVDEQRIGIQGWSYGGYLTSKVIETNTTAFSLGIAVAPVTDWRYYDTIYTERYMGTLEENEAGYTKSAVTNMEGFKHADFLLMHGSGDDNVHYLNSAALLDRLTYSGLTKFRFRMFTDSAHSMGVRGAYGVVHRVMAEFLEEKFGKPVRQKHSQED